VRLSSNEWLVLGALGVGAVVLYTLGNRAPLGTPASNASDYSSADGSTPTLLSNPLAWLGSTFNNLSSGVLGSVGEVAGGIAYNPADIAEDGASEMTGGSDDDGSTDIDPAG
jgi:hypothetical protein